MLEDATKSLLVGVELSVRRVLVEVCFILTVVDPLLPRGFSSRNSTTCTHLRTIGKLIEKSQCQKSTDSD